MAGGVWTSQNKVRPGAYINFETEKVSNIEVGTRGIVTMAMELDWGATDKLIEVTMNELLNGNSLASIGMMAGDDKSLLPTLALQNASILKLYRLNQDGVKASLSISSGEEESTSTLTVTAKYAGTFGNKIAILITPVSTEETNTEFNVQTYANGYLVDVQRVTTFDQLVNNEFVTFSGTGAAVAQTSTLLTGGTNGTAVETPDYTDYFELLKTARWNTLAVLHSNTNTSVERFIETMRADEGKYVQAVVANDSQADFEGIINNINGVVLEDETTISAVQFTAWVAGATAGAEMNESLTGKVVTGAVSIVGLKSNAEIIDGLGKGEFLLSLNQDGAVKVEKDINSLHTFIDKSYIFSKNRVIRELDEIGSSIESIWENTYLGKVTNNDNGRTLFKSSIIDYLTELQNRSAIDEFDVNNIIVEPGNDIDAVVASIAVKPLDSMEFLYMTVNINR